MMYRQRFTGFFSVADTKDEKGPQQSDIKLESIDSTTTSVDIKNNDSIDTKESEVHSNTDSTPNSEVSSSELPSDRNGQTDRQADSENSSQSVTVAEADSSTSPESLRWAFRSILARLFSSFSRNHMNGVGFDKVL